MWWSPKKQSALWPSGASAFITAASITKMSARRHKKRAPAAAYSAAHCRSRAPPREARASRHAAAAEAHPHRRVRPAQPPPRPRRGLCGSARSHCGPHTTPASHPVNAASATTRAIAFASVHSASPASCFAHGRGRGTRPPHPAHTDPLRKSAPPRGACRFTRHHHHPPAPRARRAENRSSAEQRRVVHRRGQESLLLARRERPPTRAQRELNIAPRVMTTSGTRLRGGAPSPSAAGCTSDTGMDSSITPETHLPYERAARDGGATYHVMYLVFATHARPARSREGATPPRPHTSRHHERHHASRPRRSDGPGSHRPSRAAPHRPP